MYTQTRGGLEQELTSPNAFQPFYERFAGDLPINFGQTKGLGRVNERRASRLNRRAGRWLGWLAHRDRIIQLLRLPTTADEGTFARAIGRWQQSQGLLADGIMGPCSWSRMRTALGLGLRVPCVTRVRFRNNGATDPDNCCNLCPMDLGVGINQGLGPTAANGMELRFTISGHRRGFGYDVQRTRRNSVWQLRGGAWSRLQFFPMGTWDDHHNDDECLTVRNRRIFVIDSPGFRIVLPAADGMTVGLLNGARTAADARQIVARYSFTEWVNARNRTEGIGWTRISMPVFWHNIVWLTRNAANQWVLDRDRSEIERGSLSARIINSAPV